MTPYGGDLEGETPAKWNNVTSEMEMSFLADDMT